MQDRDQALIDNQCKGSVQQKTKYMEPLAFANLLEVPLGGGFGDPCDDGRSEASPGVTPVAQTSVNHFRKDTNFSWTYYLDMFCVKTPYSIGYLGLSDIK